MKYLNLILLILGFCHFVKAVEVIPSKIEKITVFNGGAQITRTAKLSAKLGSNEVIFGRLPAGFDESSIQVRSKSKGEIHSVFFQRNLTSNFDQNETYKNLNSKLTLLIESKENLQVKLSIWKEEESLLLSNKSVAGENSGLSSLELIKTADIFRTRLLEVKTKHLELERELNKLGKEIVMIQNQLNDWKGQNSSSNNGEIILTIHYPKAMEDFIEINYIDYRASWIPSYDLRLESLNDPIELVSKGQIVQNTGENWENVMLTLSTNNPRLNSKAPTLEPWFLYPYEKRSQGMLMKGSRTPQMLEYKNEDREYNADGVNSNSGYVIPMVVNENISSIEYQIVALMNVTSNNKPHEVKIKSDEINANYDYYTVPKLDKQVYLLAHIADWNQYNLNSGSVNLYFEGTYVGQTVIDATNTSDTLQISLGSDKALTTKRENLKDFKKTTFFSNKKQVSVGWEITVKNNKSTSVDLTLMDQIPLPTNNDMEVKVDEISGAKLNAEKGILEWKVTLKPGEILKKKVAYTVKIPQNLWVNL